ncbi:MAG: Kelch repeat-containing protein [Thermoplasmatota archaeon]
MDPRIARALTIASLVALVSVGTHVASADRTGTFAAALQASQWQLQQGAVGVPLANGNPACTNTNGCAYLIGGDQANPCAGSTSPDVAMLDPTAWSLHVFTNVIPAGAGTFAIAAVYDSAHGFIYTFGGAISCTGTIVDDVVKIDPKTMTGTIVGHLNKAIDWISAVFDPVDTTCSGGCAYIFGGDTTNIRTNQIGTGIRSAPECSRTRPRRHGDCARHALAAGRRPSSHAVAHPGYRRAAPFGNRRVLRPFRSILTSPASSNRRAW